MLDKSKIGHEFEPVTFRVDEGRLRFFAKAIGETDPIHFDEAAAKAAGHRSVVATPTFVGCLEMDKPDPFEMVSVVGGDLSKALHGSQTFVYHHPVYAGDHITYKSRVKEIYDRKGGALEFVDVETEAFNQDGMLTAVIGQTVVIRNS
jgi:acyl dehydratase